MVIAMNGGFFVTFEIFLMQQWFLAMCAVTLGIVIDGGFTCECALLHGHQKLVGKCRSDMTQLTAVHCGVLQ